MTDVDYTAASWQLTMKAGVERYLQAFNDHDAAALDALFAEGALVEDPYGTTVCDGTATSKTVREFFEGLVPMIAAVQLDAPIRGSDGDAAAFCFELEIAVPEGPPMVVRAIDVMKFNREGKIYHMQAFHGSLDRMVESARVTSSPGA
ncbi:nuclear transport factor 2 family protein [uncultured Jatrophihabitans sp.]|uniref:nuclear transport factor 2 family protein n=1 Tax=uncultured Jatrophihabitans sp. TaxID=1610747 RepID=UPI0035CA88A3